MMRRLYDMILLPAAVVFWVVLLLLLLLASSSSSLVQAQPSPALYFHQQVVDHINPTGPYRGEEWTQRYYVSDKYFHGPGYPIFLILGGEGSIEPSTGLFYPFITEHLAKSLGAFVVQPEHRFYGESQPLKKKKNELLLLDLQTNNNNDTLVKISKPKEEEKEEDPRVQLFTTEQALHDAMRLVKLVQQETHCSQDKLSNDYCPVIAVGGSYPGFMAAFARILFPSRVDIAYAASAPMKFYSQQVNSYAYYNHITKVAEQTKKGCAEAVRHSLEVVQNAILNDDKNHHQEFDVVSEVGICSGTVPGYIGPLTTRQGRLQLAQELMMVVGYTFANDNMANYPPTRKGTRLKHTCEIFSNGGHSTSSFYDDNNTKKHAFERVRTFLTARLSPHHHGHNNSNNNNNSTNNTMNHESTICWDMSKQLPTGHHATISSGDWSGVGTGTNGESWDFQTCTLLVEAIGFARGSESMFPHREWTLDWLIQHCQVRFNVTPQPYQLVKKWNFTEAGLVATNVSRILFTNGLKDGWSVGGIQTNLSDSLLALNFPNGAHHSDLTHIGPTDMDTKDIQQGFQDIHQILSNWLQEIRSVPVPVQEETKIV